MASKQAIEILTGLHGQRESAESPFDEYLDIVRARDQVLGKFQSVFLKVDELTEADFREFLSFKHNKHWTGLERPTKHVCEDMELLRASLNHLFDENIPIEDRFNSIVDGPRSVKGLGPGILSALLLVKYPNKYSVWNGKSQGAMKTLHLWPDFPRGASKGEQYKQLNELCLSISEAVELDLWSLDGLWHVVNELGKQETNLAFDQLETEEREFVEGKKVAMSGFRIERDAKAREKCLNSKGHDCAVCGFSFLKTFGELGLGFIHVHHREDLALRTEAASTDPEKDLVPVCPNCHAMLHKGAKPCRSIEELKRIIENQKLVLSQE